MSDYTSRPDGEYYVDQVEKPIPPQSTWIDLPAAQLVEIKNDLENKLWAIRSQPQISNILKQSIAKLTILISASTRI